jgi:predicted ATP-grasp superfamily ATP-dependent carboligase
MTLILRNTMGKISSQGIRGLMKNRITGVKADNIKANTFIGHNLLIRWGCTKSLPTNMPLEQQVNTPEAIRRVSDKAGFRMMLQDARADLVPKTWLDEYQANAVGQGTYPMVVRPQQHSKGQQFHVVNNMEEMLRATATIGPHFYVSAFIPKSLEFRVFVVQGRATCVMEKHPLDRTASVWNCDHGNMTVVHWDNWNLQAVRKSIEAFNLSGLDFGAVDVIVDNSGTSYVLEINTAPGLKYNDDGTPSYTMLCMAKCFDWIINQRSKAPIPLIETKGGYKKFIHPAICEQALLRGS